MEQPQILVCIVVVAGIIALYAWGATISKKETADKRDPYDNHYGDESF